MRHIFIGIASSVLRKRASVFNDGLPVLNGHWYYFQIKHAISKHFVYSLYSHTRKIFDSEYPLDSHLSHEENVSWSIFHIWRDFQLTQPLLTRAITTRTNTEIMKVGEWNAEGSRLQSVLPACSQKLRFLFCVLCLYISNTLRIYEYGCFHWDFQILHRHYFCNCF